MDLDLSAEERWTLETLRALNDAHQKACKPYLDRLVYLRSIQPAPRVLLTLEQAMAAGLIRAEQPGDSD